MSILIAIFVAIGFVLLVLPGIYLAGRILRRDPGSDDRGDSRFRRAQRSRRLVSGRWWATFGRLILAASSPLILSVVLGVLNLASLLNVSSVSVYLTVNAFISAIGSILYVPVHGGGRDRHLHRSARPQGGHRPRPARRTADRPRWFPARLRPPAAAAPTGSEAKRTAMGSAGPSPPGRPPSRPPSFDEPSPPDPPTIGGWPRNQPSLPRAPQAAARGGPRRATRTRRLALRTDRPRRQARTGAEHAPMRRSASLAPAVRTSACGLRPRTTADRRPPLADPNFWRTVVLVVEHSAEGALGLVLNRPSETTSARRCPELGGMIPPETDVLVGGPVQQSVGDRARRVRGSQRRGDCSRSMTSASSGRSPPRSTPTRRSGGTRVRRPRRLGPRAAGRRARARRLDPRAGARPTTRSLPAPRELWPSVLTRKGGSYALIATDAGGPLASTRTRGVPTWPDKPPITTARAS